jgi:transcriptional regulator with XRE-family HTH domain
MHFFGAEVRHARTAAGMTQSELGAAIGYDGSEVSRVEAGTREPSEKFAEGCDRAFPQMNCWFMRFYQEAHKWDGPYPRWFLDWVRAEREALTLRMWQVELVPGLLQVPEYARALFKAWQRMSDDDEIDALVNGRLERQAILDKPDAPELWVILDEAVLHLMIGSPKIMRDQLEHLMDMAARPSVAVQILPGGTGAHAGLLGAFALATVDSSPDILYLDTAVQGQTVIETALVRKAASVFDRLRADALPRGTSSDLIQKVANERWTTE